MITRGLGKYNKLVTRGMPFKFLAKIVKFIGTYTSKITNKVIKKCELNH